jgi:hypothetical protein
MPRKAKRSPKRRTPAPVWPAGVQVWHETRDWRAAVDAGDAAGEHVWLLYQHQAERPGCCHPSHWPMGTPWPGGEEAA